MRKGGAGAAEPAGRRELKRSPRSEEARYGDDGEEEGRELWSAGAWMRIFLSIAVDGGWDKDRACGGKQEGADAWTKAWQASDGLGQDRTDEVDKL